MKKNDLTVRVPEKFKQNLINIWVKNLVKYSYCRLCQAYLDCKACPFKKFKSILTVGCFRWIKLIDKDFYNGSKPFNEKYRKRFISRAREHIIFY